MDRKHVITPERAAVINHVFEGDQTAYDAQVVCDLIQQGWGQYVEPEDADRIYCSLALDLASVSRSVKKKPVKPVKRVIPQALRRLLEDTTPTPRTAEERFKRLVQHTDLDSHQPHIGLYLSPLHAAHHRWEQRHLNAYRKQKHLRKYRTQV